MVFSILFKMRNVLLYYVFLSFISTAVLSLNFESVLKNSENATVFHYCEFNKLYKFQANNATVLVLVFNKTENSTIYPARITTSSDAATEENPLLFAAWQKSQLTTWEVPRLVPSNKNLLYRNVTRTLCPHYVNINSTAHMDSFFITVSIDASNTDFTIRAQLVDDFVVDVGRPISFTVSPAHSQFYSFTFPDYLSSGVLRIKSDNSVCMSLSVQNFSCPVYDQENNLKFTGYWETITKSGGMLLTKEAFPLRVFLVFVVHSNDGDCSGHIEGNSGSPADRIKRVELEIIPSITYQDYLIAMAAVLIAFALMYIGAFGVFVWAHKRKERNELSEEYDSFCGEASVVTQTLSGADEVGFFNSDQLSSNTSTLARPRERIIKLCLNDLAKVNHDVMRRRSNLYLWNLMTIAIFYSLPVVQLVLTYQKVLNSTGNQDLCYYNFLCSRKLGQFSDFNHIYSNIGYILLGILFLLIVYRRHATEKKKATGIPQHYGLYYTLGAALFMEGILSGCYHFCPNHSNFQFDTSFMYILAIISILKIYHSRHPDINASAYTAFGLLAVVITLGMCGVLYISTEFYVAFCIFHVCICLFLSAQIYYMGQWKLDSSHSQNIKKIIISKIRSGRENYCRPKYPSRMALLVLGNVCNWALIASGLFFHMGDFATYLLAILLCNLLIYFSFYIIMKLILGEKILFQPLIYTVLALISWAAAGYFFYHKTISWKLTPAQSRTFNRPCVLFDFYDNHDIWHFLSAVSMFFSFMVLLTLDDDIANVDRSLIPVF
ncbi:SID1 transmembrane family member 2 [Nilaparvata lugens]|uniref:SID1 transmembrane family member 2 n=1 Tax=Nilaparvata lugens TaxID=108931 RepID=UPI00193E5C5A|nr:SID1 transmembrane family member 2 [Nilaparvata lugens]